MYQVIVTWWYQYPKSTTTIARLQDIWTVGTSPLDALVLWRRCKRVALATLFVAILPLNAFVLQGAITTELWERTQQVNITIPMAPFVDPGFSGFGFGNTSTGVWSSSWTYMWQQVINIAGNSFTQYAYFGSRNGDTNSSLKFGYDLSSTYTMSAQGAGFDVNCSWLPGEHYDLHPTQEKPSTGGLIFSSSVTWNPERPNNIGIDVFWKLGESCTGQYLHRKCLLRAATVEYPTKLQMKVDGTPYLGPFFSLQREARDKASPIVEILPVFPHEGQSGNWTYAGIATSLGLTFNSTFRVWDNINGSGGTSYTGFLGPSLKPDWINPSPWFCALSYDDGLQSVEYYQLIDSDDVNPRVVEGNNPFRFADPTEIIVGRLRQAMFLASVYTGSQVFNDIWGTTFDYTRQRVVLPYPRAHYAQKVEATQSTPIVRYAIRLYLWGVSLAITAIVIIAILPTFYGFWKLPRYPGLSPLDIARAFKAPILAQADPDIATHHLLRHVGGRNLHRDDNGELVSPKHPGRAAEAASEKGDET